MVLAPLLLLLAAIGIYAVVAYAVTLRTSEIGVRMALGATADRLVGQFVGEHLIVIGVGALAGWLARLRGAGRDLHGAGGAGRLRRRPADPARRRDAGLVVARPPRHPRRPDARPAGGVTPSAPSGPGL